MLLFLCTFSLLYVSTLHKKKIAEGEKKDVDEASQVSAAERFWYLWHLVVQFRSNLATFEILHPATKIPGSTAAALAGS